MTGLNRPEWGIEMDPVQDRPLKITYASRITVWHKHRLEPEHKWRVISSVMHLLAFWDDLVTEEAEAGFEG